MCEKINVPEKEYTEQEKEELFEKLKNIGELVGLKLSINESEVDSSAAFIGESKIRLRLKEAEYEDSRYQFSLADKNIDEFIDGLSYEEYILFPQIIKAFMHELSHLITMDNDDVKKYWKFHKIDHSKYDSEKYRKNPYEKLADNLGYHILVNNYDRIISILLGNFSKPSKEIIERNLRLAKKLKEKYITPRLCELTTTERDRIEVVNASYNYENDWAIKPRWEDSKDYMDSKFLFKYDNSFCYSYKDFNISTL